MTEERKLVGALSTREAVVWPPRALQRSRRAETSLWQENEKWCNEGDRIRKGLAVHADDEGLGLGFMHKDVVEGGKAAGAGCLGISGSGVLNRTGSGGGGE